MSTEAQIKANQQNAQKSTGPRTAEGKAVVSQNAVKHGLFGSEAVIKGENQADFDLFSNEMLAELAPVGAVESMMAERFVNLSWRLKRVGHMQNQAIDVMIARDEPSPLTKHVRAGLPKFLRDLEEDPRGAGPELVLGRAAIHDCANYKVLGQLSMYERRIENSMFKTLDELRSLRLMRQFKEREAAEEQFAPESARPREKKGDLKKQSQFAPAKMRANSFLKGDYENKPRPGLGGKQTQTKPISRSRTSQRNGKKRKIVSGTYPSAG
jgi:hypothetical protein